LRGLDTNVIMRYLVRDDEQQWQIAARYINFENQGAIAWAVQQMKSGSADFSDYLINRLNQLAGCQETASFDTKLGQVEGVKLL
jgi:predicted nucleic-acid-binding protein